MLNNTRAEVVAIVADDVCLNGFLYDADLHSGVFRAVCFVTHFYFLNTRIGGEAACVDGVDPEAIARGATVNR